MVANVKYPKGSKIISREIYNTNIHHLLNTYYVPGTVPNALSLSSKNNTFPLYHVGISCKTTHAKGF